MTIQPGMSNGYGTVTLPDGARRLIIQANLRYTGVEPTSEPVFGAGGTIRNVGKLSTGLNVIRRQPDWPERLAALITAAEHRPFDAARWNCGRFAMAAVVACTGRRPSWQHRPTFAAMADTAGFPRVPVPFARAGDVVLASDPDRLGVVLDAGRAAFVGPAGLLRAPITACTAAWRVG